MLRTRASSHQRRCRGDCQESLRWIDDTVRKRPDLLRT